MEEEADSVRNEGRDLSQEKKGREEKDYSRRGYAMPCEAVHVGVLDAVSLAYPIAFYLILSCLILSLSVLSCA